MKIAHAQEQHTFRLRHIARHDGKVRPRRETSTKMWTWASARETVEGVGAGSQHSPKCKVTPRKRSALPTESRRADRAQHCQPPALAQHVRFSSSLTSRAASASMCKPGASPVLPTTSCRAACLAGRSAAALCPNKPRRRAPHLLRCSCSASGRW